MEHIKFTISLTTDKERRRLPPFQSRRPPVSTHITIAEALTQGWRQKGTLAYECLTERRACFSAFASACVPASLPRQIRVDDASSLPSCTPSCWTLATCTRSLPFPAYHRRAAFLASVVCRTHASADPFARPYGQSHSRMSARSSVHVPKLVNAV